MISNLKKYLDITSHSIVVFSFSIENARVKLITHSFRQTFSKTSYLCSSVSKEKFMKVPDWINAVSIKGWIKAVSSKSSRQSQKKSYLCLLIGFPHLFLNETFFSELVRLALLELSSSAPALSLLKSHNSKLKVSIQKQKEQSWW